MSNILLSRLLKTVIVPALVLALAVACLACASTTPPAEAAGMLTLNADGRQRKAMPVNFNHERHAALVKSDVGPGCTVCHDTTEVNGKNEPDFQFFKGTRGKSASGRRDVFHKTCVSCHAAQNYSKNTGPVQVQCRSCHGPAMAGTDFTPLFGKALHYKHVESEVIKRSAADMPGLAPGALVSGESPQNCVVCHHEVLLNPQDSTDDRKITDPDSCKACHYNGPGSATNAVMQGRSVPEFRLAAHTRCISCHVETAQAKSASGPVDCASCHDPVRWAALTGVGLDAVMSAGQPAALVLNSPSRLKSIGDLASHSGSSDWTSSMPLVSFNHSMHEKTQQSCGSCHHATVRQACSDCHTPFGSEKGDGVNLAQAMHSPKGPLQSCVSCHNKLKTTSADCAGCHLSQPVSMSAGKCAFCHRPGNLESKTRQVVLNPAQTSPVTLIFRPDRVTPGPLEKDRPLPDLVTLGVLSRDYEAVSFNHKKHVERLVKKISQGAPGMLPRHEQGYTLCSGCHHNSPAGATPPKCISCHKAALTDGKRLTDDGRPLLKAAYHHMCMSCHARMDAKEVLATDCAKCHAPVRTATR